MAEAAARHLGHVYALRRHHRQQRERGLVADAARGVLVGLDARDGAQVQRLSGVHHRQREIQRLAAGHPSPHYGHQQGAGLVVGYAPVHDAFDEKLYLLTAQLSAVALFANYICHQHGLSLRYLV